MVPDENSKNTMNKSTQAIIPYELLLKEQSVSWVKQRVIPMLKVIISVFLPKNIRRIRPIKDAKKLMSPMRKVT